MSSAAASQIPLEKTIVLIVPAEGMDDEAGLRASLVTPGRGVRVLLCIPEDVDPSLAASVAKSLAAIGIETQILLHAQAQGLGTGAFELRAPADMSGNDQIEFALALSDVVLNVDASEPQLERSGDKVFRNRSFGSASRSLDLFQSRSITSGLDPEQPGWLSDRQSTVWTARAGDHRNIRFRMARLEQGRKSRKHEAAEAMFSERVESPILFRSRRMATDRARSSHAGRVLADRHAFRRNGPERGVWLLHPPRSYLGDPLPRRVRGVRCGRRRIPLEILVALFWGGFEFVALAVRARPDFRFAPLRAAGPLDRLPPWRRTTAHRPHVAAVAGVAVGTGNDVTTARLQRATAARKLNSARSRLKK